MELINEESSDIVMEDKYILFALVSNCNNLGAFCGGDYDGWKAGLPHQGWQRYGSKS